MDMAMAMTVYSCIWLYITVRIIIGGGIEKGLQIESVRMEYR